MKEQPILLNAPMVLATLEGRKTQTRRPIRDLPEGRIDGWEQKGGFWFPFQHTGRGFIPNTPVGQGRKCPFGESGDRLWVQEEYSPDDGDVGGMCYRADPEPWADDEKWIPPSRMPRWASRITLEIAGVRVERVQEMREEDAWAEGCEGYDDDVTGGLSGWSEYATLWDSIYAKKPGHAWEDNPWVWVVEFRRVTP